MTPWIDSIRAFTPRSRGGRPVCFACGRTISPQDSWLRVRGGSLVHRSCATYELRRHRR